MTWRDEVRTCACGGRFAPKRDAQTYCSKRCANAATQRRKRSGDITPAPTKLARSGDTAANSESEGLADGSTMVWPVRNETPPGPTPGALQGDDYPLEYDENGFPELPACLDRRRKPLAKAA
jgi:hypothetical protein